MKLCIPITGSTLTIASLFHAWIGMVIEPCLQVVAIVTQRLTKYLMIFELSVAT